MAEKITIQTQLLNPLEDYSSEKMVSFLNCYNQAKLQLFLEKDKAYGGSWMQDGILGAYFNLKRKIDRIKTRFQTGDLFKFDSDSTGEANIDTFMDLDNYSGMNVAFLFFSIKNKKDFDTFTRKIRPLADCFEFDEVTNTVKRK